MIDVYYCVPNIPKSDLQIFCELRLISSNVTLYVKFANDFQLTTCKEILETFYNSQWNSNLLIRKTISSHYPQQS